MSLQSGTELGHYRLVEKIGQGGMGEVWRATDTTLQRDVAIKVLPGNLADDPERMARFEREARLLASFSHPRMATVHGLHKADGVQFLAMELVPGEDLARRLQRGPLPVAEVLAVALQVAEALQAAHAAGIIHRDLKPANIRLSTGTEMAGSSATGVTAMPGGLAVKVLDFGLAKALSPEPAGPDSENSMSPTLTMGATAAGMILGTAAYMAPEQARGYAADARADIWAFGVVLYEMLTGTRLFDGRTVSDTLAAVLRAEPDLDQLPADTPPAVRRLLTRCLAREPEDRLYAMADARLELREGQAERERGETGAGPAQAGPARRGGAVARLAPWLLALLMTLLVVVAWFRPWQEPEKPVTEAPVAILTVQLVEEGLLSNYPGRPYDISRDGRTLVVARDGGYPLLVRSLDSRQVRELPGTEGATNPFFSPDGSWIGFFATKKLKKIPVSGGTPQVLAHAADNRGGWWNEEGQILYAPATLEAIHQVSDRGGEPEVVTVKDNERERSHRWPQALPGGRVLVTVQPGGSSFDDAQLEVWTPATGERKVIFRGGSNGRYMKPGMLLFANRSGLHVAGFDLENLEMTTPPVLFQEELNYMPGHGGASLAFSDEGHLLIGHGALNMNRVVRIDAKGDQTPLLDEPAYYGRMTVSPDSRTLAGFLETSQGMDIWMFDLERQTQSRFTFTEWDDFAVSWVPGTRDVIFSSEGGGTGQGLFRQSADGSGQPRPIVREQRMGEYFYIGSFTPGNTHVLYTRQTGGEDESSGIYMMPLREGAERADEVAILETPFAESFPALSPDGRWLVYLSDETGVVEVYIRGFGNESGRWQVSAGGGIDPAWSADGRAIYFRQGNSMLKVDFALHNEVPLLGKPEEIFQAAFADPYGLGAYSVDPADGTFVATVSQLGENEASRGTVVLILNADQILQRVSQGR